MIPQGKGFQIPAIASESNILDRLNQTSLDIVPVLAGKSCNYWYKCMDEQDMVRSCKQSLSLEEYG